MLGKCLCNEIQFEIAGPLPHLYQCHCSQCRRQSGTSSNTATVVDSGNFRWVAGQAHITSWRHDSGFRSNFCSTCGCPVPNLLGDLPYYWIPIGLLDDVEHKNVSVHLFVGSKAEWDIIPPGGISYDTMPELSKFITLLNSHEKT